MVWPNATHIDPYHPYFLCAYDILDLPRHAKSPLSIVASRSDYLSLSPSFFTLPFLMLLSGRPPTTPHIFGLKGHITLTPCVSCVNLSISLPVGSGSQ